MASSKEFLEYILEQLSEVEEITYRAMMGEMSSIYWGFSPRHTPVMPEDSI